MNTRPFSDTHRFSRFALAGACLSAVALVSGCANNQSSASVYRPDQAQREQTVRLGQVVSVHQVTIDSGTTGVGTIGGGVVGGVAGSSIGGGRGSIITSVLGAIAGGVAGNMIEGGVAGRKAGLEITVRFDSGEVRSIVQAADETFSAGERVRVVSSGGVSRVTRL